MKRPGIARYYATALLANLSQGYLDGECLFRVDRVSSPFSKQPLGFIAPFFWLAANGESAEKNDHARVPFIEVCCRSSSTPPQHQDRP